MNTHEQATLIADRDQARQSASYYQQHSSNLERTNSELCRSIADRDEALRRGRQELRIGKAFCDSMREERDLARTSLLACCEKQITPPVIVIDLKTLENAYVGVAPPNYCFWLGAEG